MIAGAIGTLGYSLCRHSPEYNSDSTRLTLGSLDQGVRNNPDGSVDLYIGPKPPADQESNWLYTPAGKGWFPWFRAYGPEKAFLDKSWKMPDIEKIN